MAALPKNPQRRRVVGTLLGLVAMPNWAAPAADAFASNFQGLALRDQDDRAFDIGRLAGRVLLVNFIYTGCSTVCPVQTQVLAQVQADLPADVRTGVHFVSVSLDPLADTPAALKAYAARFSVDLRRWSFVTGRPTDVERVSERLRLFRREDTVRRPDDHATTLWLVDARGRLVQRLHGQPPDARRLGSELAVLRRMG
ncbi:SCO family protein [Pseudorhodoferax sp. Leaf274]|uniref:SCO family protein n=1 Tax=Pseudorhodoferax sp. Leaf274 TaxID=1736318 RepID=UPI000702F4E6|nr:SCO family protein [Pseudorhodoferax sp. Leaf274]KQP37363.1 hypothetical protein ASF44_13460 [Pseudorhodoferax sp. Leaf274]